jgi:hypothetical protein
MQQRGVSYGTAARIAGIVYPFVYLQARVLNIYRRARRELDRIKVVFVR